MSIISVWESPTNEGTQCYAVGRERHRGKGYRGDDGKFRYEIGWTVGRIEVCDPPVAERHERYNVYDTEGKLRAVLPAAACAYELDGEGQ